MPDAPSTDDVRDIWVDYHLNPLPRVEGIALVPEYQQAFDAWLETIRADEEARVAFYLARKQSDDLRAQVKAMYDSRPVKNTAYTQALADVLALFDGGSDD